MNQRIGILVALLPLAGCVDTPDSVAKELRNANNEHIDALMMVTNETQAERMTIRVFSRMDDRYKDIDKKWGIFKANLRNKPNQDEVRAFLWSDEVHLCLAEYKLNAERLTLEMARLRELLKQSVNAAKMDAAARGENPADVTAENTCKSLNALVNTKRVLNPLQRELEKSALSQLIQDLINRADAETNNGFQAKVRQFNKPRGDEIKLVK